MNPDRLLYALAVPLIAGIFSLPTGGQMSNELTIVFSAAKLGAWLALAAGIWRIGKYTLNFLQETTVYLAETRATTNVVREIHPDAWDGHFADQMATKQKAKAAAK